MKTWGWKLVGCRSMGWKVTRWKPARCRPPKWKVPCGVEIHGMNTCKMETPMMKSPRMKTHGMKPNGQRRKKRNASWCFFISPSAIISTSLISFSLSPHCVFSLLITPHCHFCEFFFFIFPSFLYKIHTGVGFSYINSSNFKTTSLTNILEHVWLIIFTLVLRFDNTLQRVQSGLMWLGIWHTIYDLVNSIWF